MSFCTWLERKRAVTPKSLTSAILPLRLYFIDIPLASLEGTGRATAVDAREPLNAVLQLT